MRIAALADIHGNLPALEAVLADVDAVAPDLVVNLGDLVSGPLWPRETLELLATRDLPTVRGNHDRLVAETPRGDMGASDAFAHDALDAAARAGLGALPAVLEFEGVLAVHGRPGDDASYLLEDVADGRLVPTPDAEVRARLAGVRARVVLCGHSHLAAMRWFEDGLLVVNPGSVGQPAYADPTHPAHVVDSGSPHARWALLDLAGDGVSVQLRAIAYAHEHAARRAEANGRPGFARGLRTGVVPRRGD